MAGLSGRVRVLERRGGVGASGGHRGCRHCGGEGMPVAMVMTEPGGEARPVAASGCLMCGRTRPGALVLLPGGEGWWADEAIDEGDGGGTA